MKILHIIYSLGSGGAERFVVDLCNRQSMNSNNEVILLSICDSNNPANAHYVPELTSKVRFENLHLPSGLSLKSILGVYRFIKKEKPAVVHCHSNLMLLYLPMLFLKCKYVHTLHSTALHCLSNKRFKGINHYFYTHKVQPITISEDSSRNYQELYNLKNDICITNGREPLRRTSEVPAEFSNAKDSIIFIHVASCTKPKNHERLFRVFKKLEQEHSDFHLFCLGQGYDMYRDLNIEDEQIHFLGEKSNVADYLSFSDFFVLSSDYEGLPISLLEAMSLGVVPICTPAGGIKDVLRDGENGYMTSTFDDEEFYQKVKQAIAERGRITKDALMNEYQAQYTMKVCADKYYNAYIK